MNATIIEQFKAFLQEKNYGEGTICGYIRTIRDLKDPPVDGSTTALIAYIDEAYALKQATLTVSNFNIARGALYRLFFWLTGTEIKVARKQAYILGEENPLLRQYRDYCCSFLHLTKAVTDASVREVKLFLSFLSDDADNINWIGVTADDVIRFLSANRSKLQISSLGVTVTAIRRFFRFLQFQGVEIHTSILLLPLSTPDWSKNGILPKVLSESDHARLENYEFPNTSDGCRDHVVLLCFIELGLRCSEVAKLMLSDVKWNSGSIIVSKTKTHYERELPISKRLGGVLEKYILYYRPNNNGPQLFFQSSRFRCKPVTTETVRSIIRRIFVKVGISGWWVGTHSLRRSVGSRLHNAGNGLKSVSDLLGHKSINTSKAYVRVDVNSLKSIADTWPDRRYYE